MSESTPTILIEPSGRFGIAFADALKRKNMSLIDFARVIDASYENLRKIYKGLSLPGKFVVDQMVKELKMDKEEAEKLIAQERMEKKVGKKAMQSVFGRHPRSGDFDAIIPFLSDDQLAGILAQMKVMVHQNKARKSR
jgi:hypothetical protein